MFKKFMWLFKKKQEVLPEIGSIWYVDYRQKSSNPFMKNMIKWGDILYIKILDIKKGSDGITYVQYARMLNGNFYYEANEYYSKTLKEIQEHYTLLPIGDPIYWFDHADVMQQRKNITNVETFTCPKGK